MNSWNSPSKTSKRVRLSRKPRSRPLLRKRQGKAGAQATRPRKLPANLPVERRVELQPCRTCSKCGSSRLHKLGETVSKTLECEPRRWKIIEHVRKNSAGIVKRSSQSPAPSHAIPRGFAGPSLLATILVAKFLLHQPLTPPERHVRTECIEIDTSTLADHVGACVVALDPIVQALKVHVLAAERIHTDDNCVLCRAGQK